MQAQMLQTM
jgi:hypothetical protein